MDTLFFNSPFVFPGFDLVCACVVVCLLVCDAEPERVLCRKLGNENFPPTLIPDGVLGLESADMSSLLSISLPRFCRAEIF